MYFSVCDIQKTNRLYNRSSKDLGINMPIVPMTAL